MITIEDLKKFTYNAYIKLLDTLNERYTLIPCSKVRGAQKPYLAVRHDVDGSLESALKMSKIENELGITATYFVLLSHKLYNVFEVQNLRTLKEIIQLGHEIGLHYDPEAFKEYSESPYILLDKQIEIISSLMDVPIKTIAMHRNSLTELRDPFLDIPYLSTVREQFLNMGNLQLFDLTVKDSCRIWVDEYVQKLLSFEYDRVQLLTHPFLWHKNEMNREMCLETLFNETEYDNEEYRRNWLGVWEDGKPATSTPRNLGVMS